MAHDEAAADRLRELLAGREGVSEKRIFGSRCWLCDGNLAVGLWRGDQLILRLGPGAEAALEEAEVAPFAPSGQPMRGWVTVAGVGDLSDERLASWVDEAWRFAQALPPK